MWLLSQLSCVGCKCDLMCYVFNFFKEMCNLYCYKKITQLSYKILSSRGTIEPFLSRISISCLIFSQLLISLPLLWPKLKFYTWPQKLISCIILL